MVIVFLVHATAKNVIKIILPIRNKDYPAEKENGQWKSLKKCNFNVCK